MPTFLKRILQRTKILLRGSRKESELDAEVQFHLDMMIEENTRSGMSPEAARRAALRKFGGVVQVKEACREAWGVTMVATLPIYCSPDSPGGVWSWLSVER